MGADIAIGTAVWTSDGQEIGRVAAVVVDPVTEMATDIVVRYGLAVEVDKVIPINYIREVVDHQVKLAIPAEEVGEMPDLEERAYIPLPDTEEDLARGHVPSEPDIWSNRPAVALPPLVSSDTSIEANVVEEWRNVPDGNLVLREGLPVRSNDGKGVGNIAELVTDPATRAVTHIVVRRGRLRPREVAIPVEWIERSNEDSGITLAVDGKAVKELPDYH